jgi:hypothetical protein
MPVSALHRLNARLEVSTLPRLLPAIALTIGCLWILGVWAYGGMRTAADTDGYMARVSGLAASGSYLGFLYSESIINAHMFTVWLLWFGPNLFVLLTCALTALLPFLVDRVLAQNGAAPVFRCGALLCLSVHPELYKWSLFVLTDGFFLIQTVILLAVLSRRSYPGAWWVLIPLLVYNLVYTRPTGLLVLPAMAAFAVAELDSRRRTFILTVTAVTTVWVVGWIVVGGGDSAQHVNITRERFIEGHVLQDPNMGVPMDVPFTKAQAADRSIPSLCVSYPGYCLRYYVRKPLAFFVPVFPKYSLRHNVMNGLYFGSLALLSIASVIGLARIRSRPGWAVVRHAPEVKPLVFCAVAVAVAGAFHTVTHIDSDARYLMVWVPLWVTGVFLALSVVARAGTVAAPDVPLGVAGTATA